MNSFNTGDINVQGETFEVTINLCDLTIPKKTLTAFVYGSYDIFNTR